MLLILRRWLGTHVPLVQDARAHVNVARDADCESLVFLETHGVCNAELRRHSVD
jgi:hypothetical protein